MPLTRKQKQAVAMLIMRGAADIAEAFTEEPESHPERETLEDVSYRELTECMAQLLKGLPGDEWDMRLPLPKGK